MEQIIFVGYYIFVIGSIIYAIVKCTHLYFYGERSEKEMSDFIEIKGYLYIILSVISIIFTFLLEDSYDLIVINTVCIAIFEAVQSIFQAKANRHKMQANKKLNELKPSILKEIEWIDEFCQIKLQELEKNGADIYRKLIYEEVNDYLKYYVEAEEFLKFLNQYQGKKGELEELYKLEEIFINNFQSSCVRVVRGVR